MLEEGDVRLAVVTPLGKVVPAPSTVLLVHLALDGVDRKVPQRAVAVLVNLVLRRAVRAVLPLPDVEMEQVDHAERVAVLVAVEDESELLEEELGVRLGGASVDLLVHDEATRPRHGLEHELVRGRVPVAGNSLGELDDGVRDVVPGEGRRVRVKVDGERVERRELVHAALGVGDVGRLPVGVGRDGREAGEGEADGEGVAGHRELVLVADVDVADLCTRSLSVSSRCRGTRPLHRQAHLNLQVVDNLVDQARREALVLLLVLGAQPRVRPGRQHLGALELVELGRLCSCSILFGCRL